MQPAMPGSERRARLPLERGCAGVHHLYPFTIRLKRRTGGEVEPARVKIDPGSKTVTREEDGNEGTDADGSGRRPAIEIAGFWRGVVCGELPSPQGDGFGAKPWGNPVTSRLTATAVVRSPCPRTRTETGHFGPKETRR